MTELRKAKYGNEFITKSTKTELKDLEYLQKQSKIPFTPLCNLQNIERFFLYNLFEKRHREIENLIKKAKEIGQELEEKELMYFKVGDYNDLSMLVSNATEKYDYKTTKKIIKKANELSKIDIGFFKTVDRADKMVVFFETTTAFKIITKSEMLEKPIKLVKKTGKTTYEEVEYTKTQEFFVQLDYDVYKAFEKSFEIYTEVTEPTNLLKLVHQKSHDNYFKLTDLVISSLKYTKTLRYTNNDPSLRIKIDLLDILKLLELENKFKKNKNETINKVKSYFDLMITHKHIIKNYQHDTVNKFFYLIEI